MPVTNWVCLPISCGLYLPSTGYYQLGIPVGYTCHQLGIPTYQMWAIPVTNWVYLPTRRGLYLSSTGYYLPTRRGLYLWQTGYYLPTRCGLYLSPTGYTYLPHVGYTCHQLRIPTYQIWAIPVTNWVYLPFRAVVFTLPGGYIPALNQTSLPAASPSP